ncbi:MAG: phosphoribosylamine--glycine ligase [Gammaproteobacteria bacterium]|nr:phosphoribosylamine--glycine ligase [Gammaproteobacteria bacterium]
MSNILLVGGGGREHAIAEALCRDDSVRLFAVMNCKNPGIIALSQSDDWVVHNENDINWVTNWADEKNIDFAVVGFEEPLGEGLCDELENRGIPALGPKKEAARLETSKVFTRVLLDEYDIPGNAEYQLFSDPNELSKFLKSTSKQYALKPVGLTAGKGVKIMGEQLKTTEEAIQYGHEVIQQEIGQYAQILLEERLTGEEFTLQCFVDGKTLVPMPLVQDFKRASEGDKGPNTGGMGSYSQANGLLPFVTEDDRDEALSILEKIIAILSSKKGIKYQGVLYGQFMIGGNGIKLVEINARFGDPEAMNVLSLLETSLVDICKAIINGTLDKLNVRFSNKASVCTYVAPPGYETGNPKSDSKLVVDEPRIKEIGAELYYAKVELKHGAVLTTSSRSLAVVGIADTTRQAHAVAEDALHCIKGEFHARHDIGKKYFSSEETYKDIIDDHNHIDNQCMGVG